MVVLWALIRTLLSLITSLKREATERWAHCSWISQGGGQDVLFVASCLLSLVLSHNHLSLLFQTKSVDLSHLRPMLTATIEAIKGVLAARDVPESILLCELLVSFTTVLWTVIRNYIFRNPMSCKDIPFVWWITSSAVIRFSRVTSINRE